MKRHFLVFACLSTTFASSHAQSKVELYGIVDAGVTRVSGIKGGSVTQLSSGIMEGSRIGLRGTEDLGEGYRAVFTLENRLEADTGDISNRPPSRGQLPDRATFARYLVPSLPAAQQAALQPLLNQVSAGIGTRIGINVHTAGPNFFDRQIYAGLITPVGAVLAGRMYTPAYELAGTFDALAAQSSLALGQIAVIPYAIDIRAGNALAYRVQQGGWTASVMYGFDEKTSETGRFVGALCMYKSDAFGLGLAYNTRENEGGQKSLTSLVVGGHVSMGAGRVYATAASIRDGHPSAVSSIAAQITPLVGPALAAVIQDGYVNVIKQDAQLYHLGYKVVIGPNTLYAAYNFYNDRRADNADVASFGVAYTYALSKRTDLNAAATRFNNTGLGQAAPGGGGYLGGVTAHAGADSTSLALGLRHRF
ncbi:MAG: porin [Burkholderiaceae bacterium]|nr:porin [Burkholderiaceae bacterium]